MSNVYRANKKSSGGANLQTKTVTATVNAQTVLPDSGYDGMSEVTVNPQDHTGTHELVTTNYPASNPLDLGANHNVRYVPIQVSEGAFQETTLWENANPTASFSAQTVTISDDMTNYDYVRIYWNNSIGSSENASIIVPTDIMAMSGAVAGSLQITLGSRTSVDNRVRIVRYSSNTGLYIGGNTSVGEAGGNNNGIIPIKITGLSPIVVSGTKTITQNGTGIDVANYAAVDVNVSAAEQKIFFMENGVTTYNGGYTRGNLTSVSVTNNSLKITNGSGLSSDEYFAFNQNLYNLVKTVFGADVTQVILVLENLSSNSTSFGLKTSLTSTGVSYVLTQGTHVEETIDVETTLKTYKFLGKGSGDGKTVNIQNIYIIKSA